MARAPVPPSRNRVSAVLRPWTLLLAGLGFVVVSLLLATTTMYPARLILAGIGLLLAGAAVSRRLQSASDVLEDRIESAGLVALSGLAPLLALFGTEKSWDSAQMFLGVLV